MFKMNFRKLILVTVLLLTPGIALSELQASFGVGFQYGGFPGAQLTKSIGENRFSAGVGVIGLSLGYERNLAPKHTLGIHAYAVIFILGGAASYNYYFNGSENAGWRVGIDVGVVGTTLVGVGSDDSTSNNVFVLPSVGYQF